MPTENSIRYWIRALMISIFAASTLSTPAFAATIWDLNSNWSETANPNGPWSLNSDSTILPHISGSTLPGGALVSQPGYAQCSSCRGFWFKASILPSNIDWSLGDVIVHTQDQFSDPYNHAANVTWTSPITGIINVTGSVWMDDLFPARASQWNLYVKNVRVSSGLLSGTDVYSRSSPYSLLTGTGGASPFTNVLVHTGDVVKLEIVRTTFDGFFVGTNLTISLVPEPGPSHLWLTGGLFAFLAKRRSRGIVGN